MGYRADVVGHRFLTAFGAVMGGLVLVGLLVAVRLVGMWVEVLEVVVGTAGGALVEAAVVLAVGFLVVLVVG